MGIWVINGEMPAEKKQAYIDYIERKHNCRLKKLEITIDGDYVDLKCTFVPQNFERIRRMVGAMDRWNNAKAAEERDRVKHI